MQLQRYEKPFYRFSTCVFPISVRGLTFVWLGSGTIDRDEIFRSCNDFVEMVLPSIKYFLILLNLKRVESIEIQMFHIETISNE